MHHMSLTPRLIPGIHRLSLRVSTPLGIFIDTSINISSQTSCYHLANIHILIVEIDSFIHSTFENNVTARCANLPDPARFSLPELKRKLAYEEDFNRWHSIVLETLRAFGVEDIIYSVTFLFVFLPLS